MNKPLSKLLVTGALAASLLPSAYAAAGSEGHGGNVVICSGRPAVVLDYYNAALPTIGGPANMKDLSGFTSQQVIDFVRWQLHNRVVFLSVLDSALRDLGPIDNWIAADLKQIDDSAEPYNLPPGCVRRTAAIRQDGEVMYGDPSVISLLSEAQKGILRLHEAFYWISSTSGNKTSSEVRRLMRVLLQKNPDPSELTYAIGGIGGDVSYFDGITLLHNGRYSGQDFHYGTPTTSSSGFEVSVNWAGKVSLKNVYAVDWEPKNMEFDCSDSATTLLSNDRVRCKLIASDKGTPAMDLITYDSTAIQISLDDSYPSKWSTILHDK